MLHIPCPWCGERPHYEFSFEGDATVEPAATSDDGRAWAEHLYFRTNPAGPHAELWYHRDGCRQWLRVTRDTVTQAVLAAVSAGEAPAA